MSKQDCGAGHGVKGKGSVKGKVSTARQGKAAGSPSLRIFSGLQLENRAYQARIVEKSLAMFEGTHRDQWGEMQRAAHSVLVESPTGSGKTIMGLEIARQLQHRFGCSVGWASMRRNLLLQAQQENERRGFGVDPQLISMFDKQPPQVDLLVVDEAQHDAAASMANLHSIIRPRYVLGMTATPFRTDRIKLCFDRIIKDAGIHQLIQDGFLSRYHHFTIRRYSPASVAECYLREPDRWGKSLIFFHRLVQCNECCERLTQGGVRAEVVTARTDRQRQIADFSEGKIDVLLNMAILTEGFDCPSLKTVFCRPSGRACTIQMAGRVFRKCADMPFKQIVQCNNTRHPFVKTALADEQYAWSEEGWRTLKLNRQITAISDVARRAIAAVDVKLPPIVANHRRRSLPWEAREETFQL